MIYFVVHHFDVLLSYHINIDRLRRMLREEGRAVHVVRLKLCSEFVRK